MTRNKRVASGAAPLSLRLYRVPSPIGELMLLIDDQDRLRAADWADRERRLLRLLRLRHGRNGCVIEPKPGAHDIAKSVRAYFRGDLGALDRLPVCLDGTDFQNAVWRELRRIPAGATKSYAQLARRVGRPAAVRAVGAANGANPVSVVIPCHRLVGSDGALTGYGGGMARKHWLLAHEGAIPA